MGTVTAISRQRAVGAGRGATIVAAACSAALHGALAAGMFLWPAGPVPYSASNPIVVELVAEAPQSRVGGVVAMGSASDNGPNADVEVALSVQSDPDDAEPIADAAAVPAPSPKPIARVEPPTPRTTVPIASAPVVPRPAWRPDAPPAEHTDPSPAGLETTTASDATSDGPAVAALAGESPPSGAGAGGDMASDGDVAAGPHVGPRFAVGSADNPLPRYPMAARRRGLEGRVVLRVFVAADGRARSVSVWTASPHPILDEAAAETLRRWRFEPARQAGVPVAAWIDVPITFRLRD
ncbi:MAG: energy transducer TonB [Rhodospirillales bacterium]|nr:energy transducer TonB [Rhodospirillales bacterium]